MGQETLRICRLCKGFKNTVCPISMRPPRYLLTGFMWSFEILKWYIYILERPIWNSAQFFRGGLNVAPRVDNFHLKKYEPHLVIHNQKDKIDKI